MLVTNAITYIRQPDDVASVTNTLVWFSSVSQKMVRTGIFVRQRGILVTSNCLYQPYPSVGDMVQYLTDHGQLDLAQQATSLDDLQQMCYDIQQGTPNQDPVGISGLVIKSPWDNHYSSKYRR
jgi:hypothetical protein